jgi:hypothetical protein
MSSGTAYTPEAIIDACNRIRQQYPHLVLPPQQQQRQQQHQCSFDKYRFHQLEDQVKMMQKDLDKLSDKNDQLFTLNSRYKTDLRNDNWRLAKLEKKLADMNTEFKVEALVKEFMQREQIVNKKDLETVFKQIVARREHFVDENMVKKDDPIFVDLSNEINFVAERTEENGKFLREAVNTMEEKSHIFVNSVCIELQEKVHSLNVKNESLYKEVQELKGQMSLATAPSPPSGDSDPVSGPDPEFKNVEEPYQPLYQRLQSLLASSDEMQQALEPMETDEGNRGNKEEQDGKIYTELIVSLYRLPDHVDWKRLRISKNGNLLKSKICKEKWFLSKDKYVKTRKGTMILAPFIQEFKEILQQCVPILYDFNAQYHARGLE